MARDKGDPAAILQAIVSRLIDQIGSRFNESNCYLALNPDALPSSGPADITAVVAPMSGTFLESYFEGGGKEQLTTESGVIVKLHSDVKLDQPDRSTVFLTDSTRGVLRAATEVIDALADWSPVVDQNQITRDPLIPADFVITKSPNSLGAIELSFRCLFDWDLG